MPRSLDPRLSAAFAGETPRPALESALPAEVFVGPGPPEDRRQAVSGPVEVRPGQVGAPVRVNRRRRSTDEEVLPRGAIIDKYCIEHLLGRGGFAVVYRATHLLLGTAVAIKLIRPRALARQPGLAALLCQEARFAARIDHPNVVRVHDVTHNERITYVVMEYIDGRSLAEIIRLQGPLHPAEVVRVGLGVTAGLQVGLGQGLIHRDIKPANILLPHLGGVKIVDLGLALGDQPGDDEVIESAGQPVVVGTYGYMSPEQAADARRVDFRSDIYSLGATLYEAATGSLPYPARDPERGLQMQREEPLPPPQGLVPGLPETLCTLLTSMLAREPDDRPGSYQILAAALRNALGATPAAATPRRTDR